MTLDEAIKRAEEVARSCERGNPKKRSKSKCASWHSHLQRSRLKGENDVYSGRQ